MLQTTYWNNHKKKEKPPQKKEVANCYEKVHFGNIINIVIF